MAKFYVEEHKGFDAGTIINVSPTGVRKGREVLVMALGMGSY